MEDEEIIPVEAMIIFISKNTCYQMIIYHNNEIATTKMINRRNKNIIRIVENIMGNMHEAS